MAALRRPVTRLPAPQGLDRQAAALGEEIEGAAHVQTTDLHREVDCGATIAAAMAMPAPFPVPSGEDRERRCSSGLGMAGVGAWPAGGTLAAGMRAQQLLGKRPQVNSAEDSVTVVRSLRARRCWVSRCHGLLGRGASRNVTCPREVSTTSRDVRRPPPSRAGARWSTGPTRHGIEAFQAQALPHVIPVMAGDMVHNLPSSLDYVSGNSCWRTAGFPAEPALGVAPPSSRERLHDELLGNVEEQQIFDPDEVDRLPSSCYWTDRIAH